MPFTRISLNQGKSPDYAHAVSAALHQALVEAFEVPPHDKFQAIHQHCPGELVFERAEASNAGRGPDRGGRTAWPWLFRVGQDQADEPFPDGVLLLARQVGGQTLLQTGDPGLGFGQKLLSRGGQSQGLDPSMNRARRSIDQACTKQVARDPVNRLRREQRKSGDIRSRGIWVGVHHRQNDELCRGYLEIGEGSFHPQANHAGGLPQKVGEMTGLPALAFPGAWERRRR